MLEGKRINKDVGVHTDDSISTFDAESINSVSIHSVVDNIFKEIESQQNGEVLQDKNELKLTLMGILNSPNITYAKLNNADINSENLTVFINKIRKFLHPNIYEFMFRKMSIKDFKNLKENYC
jgi:hypothetical protein